MPWWEAQQQQRRLAAAAAHQGSGGRDTSAAPLEDSGMGSRVPPTPPLQKTTPPGMTADQVARFLTYKITDDQKEVIRAFKFYDKDGGGTIDRAEFRHFLEDRYLLSLNDYEFHQFYRLVDTDGTGEVDFREFRDFFNRQQFDPRVWGLGDSGYDIKINEDRLLAASPHQGRPHLLHHAPRPPPSRGASAGASRAGMRRGDVGARGTSAMAGPGRPRTSGSLRARSPSLVLE